MSKKKNRKKASPTPLAPVQPQVAGAASFGYDEMLSELEAIVAEAEIRLRDEESRRHVQHRHIRRGSLGTADADRDESGSGDHRLRKIRVDKTGTQNYNTTKLRSRGYQR